MADTIAEATVLIEATATEGTHTAAEAIANARSAGEQALAALTKEADSQLARLGQEAKARLDELNELKAEAERAVGATGAAVLAGGYQKVANTETTAANRWRWVAVGAFVGATVVAFVAVVSGLSGGFDAERFVAKVAIGLPVLGLAYYAAHESTKHREQARLNRQVELQLSSLDAYLRELPEENRHQKKTDLADGFFEAGIRGIDREPIRLRRPRRRLSSPGEDAAAEDVAE